MVFTLWNPSQGFILGGSRGHSPSLDRGSYRIFHWGGTRRKISMSYRYCIALPAMPRIYVRIDRDNVYVAIFPMENEQKICYQFCSAIIHLALPLSLLIYHSTILKFWGETRFGGGGGGEIPGHPPSV